MRNIPPIPAASLIDRILRYGQTDIERANLARITPKPVVIMFAVERMDRDFDAVATDSEGNFLSAQVCSGTYWAKRDLNHAYHRWFYANKLGDNYEVKWRDSPPPRWDGVTAHTDETLKPWHMAPENNSTLYSDEVTQDDK